jgi:molybdate transport system regulatory protein
MAVNIVVSAAGRKLGKTLFCTEIVQVLQKREFSVAFYKLKRRTEEGVEFCPGPGRENSDTWRVQQAGACETGLLKYNSEIAIKDYLPVPSSDCDVVVWETNSAALLIPHSTIVYIDAEIPEPKNPLLMDCASVIIEGPIQTVSPETIGLTLSVAGLPGFNPIRPGWKLWMESGGIPIFGKGVASLLEAIRDSGSILAASGKTGIQYRRVWTLLSKTEENLGVKLIRRSRGGPGGGGSSLTPVASMLLDRYHYLDKILANAAKQLEEDH